MGCKPRAVDNLVGKMWGTGELSRLHGSSHLNTIYCVRPWPGGLRRQGRPGAAVRPAAGESGNTVAGAVSDAYNLCYSGFPVAGRWINTSFPWQAPDPSGDAPARNDNNRNS